MAAAVAEREHGPRPDARRFGDEVGAALLEPIGELLLARAFRQNDEPVAADAEEALARCEHAAEPLAGARDVAVTVDVAEQVVALLQVVQVDEARGERPARSPQRLDGLVVGGPVAHAGQGVGRATRERGAVVRVELGKRLVERFGVAVRASHVHVGAARRHRLHDGKRAGEVRLDFLKRRDERVVVGEHALVDGAELARRQVEGELTAFLQVGSELRELFDEAVLFERAAAVFSSELVARA